MDIYPWVSVIPRTKQLLGNDRYLLPRAPFGALSLLHWVHSECPGCAVTSVHFCAVGAPWFCGSVKCWGMFSPAPQKLPLVDSQTELLPQRAHVNFCWVSWALLQMMTVRHILTSKEKIKLFHSILKAGICTQVLSCFLVHLNQGCQDRSAWWQGGVPEKAPKQSWGLGTGFCTTWPKLLPHSLPGDSQTALSEYTSRSHLLATPAVNQLSQQSMKQSTG